MFRTIRLSFACAVLGASLAPLGAQAFPISSLDSQLGSDVTLVAGGCGIGYYRDGFGVCRPNGAVVVVPGLPLVVAPPVVIAPAVVCGGGYRWHPRFRRCVVL
jgi:hypothetical protein